MYLLTEAKSNEALNLYLDQEGANVFFLLRIKCPIIGREIGYPVGNLVFEQGK